jgi:arylamine N-acetyltransferase
MAVPARVPRLPPDLVAAYLRRIGIDHEPQPSAAALARLHRAHLETVPFENFAIILGSPMRLDARAFAEKVAVQRRGGFCYELNGAFAALLAALGFEVELLEARVFSPAGPGIHFGHLALAVRLDGDTSLVDVGFGKGCFDEPISFSQRESQQDTAGIFRLAPAEDGALDLLLGDEPQYRVASAPHALEDFDAGFRFHSTSPESPFTRGTVCTLRTRDGRLTIAGTRLIETAGAAREERDLDRTGLADVLAARFGIELDAGELDLLRRQEPSPVASAIR